MSRLSRRCLEHGLESRDMPQETCPKGRRPPLESEAQIDYPMGRHH